ncbi:MAG: RNA polymerase sigma factor [Solirubrobacterales bacterium]
MRLVDRLWVHKIRQGDVAAFESLIKKYKDKIFNYSCYLVQDYQMAEEITQDVFLKVYHKINQYNPDISSLSTWIMTIAHNESINKIMRKKNELFLEEQCLKIPSTQNPEQLVLEGEVIKDLVQALNALTIKEKSILLLKDYYGYKIKEIGQMMNTSEGTVKSTLHGARLKIRERIGESHD